VVVRVVAGWLGIHLADASSTGERFPQADTNLLRRRFVPADRGRMNYINAVKSVSRSLEGGRGELSDVHAGLELVLAGWRLQSASADRGWDVLGAVAQAVAEDFYDLPPIAYTFTDGGDPAEAWQWTVQLAQFSADRLDDVADGLNVETDRAWFAATSAARLRASALVRS
jgi:hypothetical protein